MKKKSTRKKNELKVINKDNFPTSTCQKRTDKILRNGRLNSLLLLLGYLDSVAVNCT